MSSVPLGSRSRVLMLVENNYPQDSRVRNEATLLTSAGYDVTVIALKKNAQPRADVVDGVRVYRIPRLELFTKTAPTTVGPLRRLVLKIKSGIGYLTEYAYFTMACLVMSFMVLFR